MSVNFVTNLQASNVFLNLKNKWLQPEDDQHFGTVQPVFRPGSNAAVMSHLERARQRRCPLNLSSVDGAAFTRMGGSCQDV